MSGITSGTGLISGIDSASLIDQLIAIEARPRQQVEERVAVLTNQKSAFLDINAKLLALKTSASAFLEAESFGSKKATSSNGDVLTASAGTSAAVGTYSFSVSRLVSSHQMISSGFADRDTTTFGTDTQLRFESAAGRIDREVELADLNAFNGIERGSIRITDRSGASADIDLSRAVTLNDVIDAIDNAAGINVTASVQDDRLVINDNTNATANNLTVSNLGTRKTATALGIVGSVAADSLTGTQINRIDADTQLSLLNDGRGIRPAGGGQDDLRIDLGGSSFDVSLDGVATIGDVVDAINDHASNPGVTAAVGGDGVSLELTGAGAITVSALNGSNAAADLGILGSGTNTLSGDRVLATLGSKLINSTSAAGGLTLGQITVDTGSGAQAIDLTGAQSIQQVIDSINNAGAGVTAATNAAGNGIAITADNGSPLTIADSTGNFAATYNLAGTANDGVADTGDMDVQYISENTRLDSLNGGAGVSEGKFRITDSAGQTALVDLTQGETTLGEVINEINSRGIGVTASINATGDGLLLTDTAGGAVQMKVEEDGGSTAADLGILGEDTENNGFIDGSLEQSIDIAADDTLDDLLDKINAADLGVEATIINDGTSSKPFRINLSSTASGRDGRIMIDDGGLDLGLNTLVEGRDAVVFFGSADPAEAVLLTNSSNSLTDTVSGVTIELNGTSDKAVNLTVSKDVEQIVSAVDKFVKNFNAVMDRMNDLDSYDSESEERGLLLGDPTLANIKRQLLNFALQSYDDVGGQYDRLADVGITIGADARLEFDQNTFRDAMATDIDAVTQLFALKTQGSSQAEELAEGVTIPGGEVITTERGIGANLDELLRGLTDSIDGTITITANNLDSQIELANDRIDQMNDLLGIKRQRLEAQFGGMEVALARLQQQQNALQSLALAAANQSG